MAEIRSKEENPVPGIDYSEIRIPDEKNIGTGTFKTVLIPAAMNKNNPIISTIINVPFFQLLVNIDSKKYEVTVLLGKADKSPALSRKVYELSEKIDFLKAHSFTVKFINWEIKKLMMNRKPLRSLKD
jgi:hypothetical protein